MRVATTSIAERKARVKHWADELRVYQRDDLIPFMIDNPFSGAFVDMGLGKTVSILTVLQRLFTRGQIRKCLIVAPLRVAVQTWPSEIQEWSHTWWMDFTVIRADEKHPELLASCKAARAAERQEELGSPNNAAAKAKTAHILLQKKRLARQDTLIHIINREALEWLVEYWGQNWPYDCVIVDESTSFADTKSLRWKALNKVRPLIKRLHLLSGIPAPEGIEDYFAQIKLLDRGKRLGEFITRFRHKYMEPARSYKFAWTAREGSDAEVAAKIADICIIMREEDYLDRPKAIVIQRPIVLDRDELAQYKAFEKTSILSLPEVEIEAETGGALAQKLLQMASGAVYDQDKKWHLIHNHKIEEVAQIREEANGSPLLVAYWHKPSLRRLMKAFPKALVMDKEGHLVGDWNAGKIDMLFIHPVSAGHGLNMQLGPGHTIIYFDNPLPLEAYAQTIRRLDRPGQKKIVRVYHLVTQRTVDAKVVPALINKDNAQDAIKRHIRDLRKEWIA